MPPPPRAFCDTSYFYACADIDDAYHRAAVALAGDAASRGTQLWTTWDVVGETITLLRYRHSWTAAIRFLDDVNPPCTSRSTVRMFATKRRRSSVDTAAIITCPSATRCRSSSSRRSSIACPASRSTRTSGGSA